MVNAPPGHFTPWRDAVPILTYRRLIPGVHLALNPVAASGSFPGATVSPYNSEVKNMWCLSFTSLLFILFVSHETQGISCVYRDIGLRQR
jgi:hypothetical protein